MESFQVSVDFFIVSGSGYTMAFSTGDDTGWFVPWRFVLSATTAVLPSPLGSTGEAKAERICEPEEAPASGKCLTHSRHSTNIF